MIESSDNRGSDNRGWTVPVYGTINDLYQKSAHFSNHTCTLDYYNSKKKKKAVTFPFRSAPFMPAVPFHSVCTHV